MKASPIYNIISNPKRKSDCSFGSEGFTQQIQVGTSINNSHTLATITVERFVDANGIVEFTLFIDGKLMKKGSLNGKGFQMEIDKCGLAEL